MDDVVITSEGKRLLHLWNNFKRGTAHIQIRILLHLNFLLQIFLIQSESKRNELEWHVIFQRASSQESARYKPSLLYKLRIRDCYNIATCDLGPCLVDCPTQLTLIFMILIFVFVSCQLCFMTNIKSENMKKHSREICQYPSALLMSS